MDKINLGTVIEERISKFRQNRIGDKPALHVMIPAALPLVVWKDVSLKHVVRLFQHETLLSNEPDDTLT